MVAWESKQYVGIRIKQTVGMIPRRRVCMVILPFEDQVMPMAELAAIFTTVKVFHSQRRCLPWQVRLRMVVILVERRNLLYCLFEGQNAHVCVAFPQLSTWLLSSST